ncbi:MAG: Rieske (2Fe-2S) protein [Bacteroidales bacterium]|jgi:cytochrome b6-f complex iron-sulfur subunit|nr:Rieske (2Fe-2S) protein [Bacteroidales bacterium]MCU0407565.1 Rieske (2Fe-2S) protein [Bacteroidales bacterium]
MNRRESLRKALQGGAVLFLAPAVLQSCSKDDDPNNNGTPPPAGSKITIDLSLPENASLNTAGGSKVVQSVLVANTGSAFIALSSVCTHQGCTVAYVHGASNVQCPCHGSVFTTSGSVTTGPATSALTSYPVAKSGNILTISL